MQWHPSTGAARLKRLAAALRAKQRFPPVGSIVTDLVGGELMAGGCFTARSVSTVIRKTHDIIPMPNVENGREQRLGK